MRPDTARDPDGVATVDERTALLDVQLDEGADAPQRLLVAPQGRRVDTGGGCSLSQGGAAAVAQPPSALTGQPTREQSGPGTGDAEAAALLVGEDRHSERSPWLCTRSMTSSPSNT